MKEFEKQYTILTNQNNMSSRRDFIKKSAIIGTGIAMSPSLSFASNDPYKDKKLKVGLIGVGLRGTNHLNNVLSRDDVLVTAICDIDSRRIQIAFRTYRKSPRKET